MTSSVESSRNLKIPFYQDVDGFRIPGMFSAEALHSALSYKPREDDLFIVTYPKCGTTWVQNIVACIFRNGKPFETAMEFLTQTPFLEMTGAEGAVAMKRPGAIKLHLPFHLTPYSPKAKYIFVARNPKDCCVSFYHHTKNMQGYKFSDGTFDDFFELFVNGEVDFGDYFDTLLSWYEHRNDPNVLFLTYEDLKKETVHNVLRIADFMGSNYKTQLESNAALLDDVIHFSSFAYMKEAMNRQLSELASLPRDFILNQPDVPDFVRDLFSKKGFHLEPESGAVTFVRKGIVGDWRNHFSSEQNTRLEKKFWERTKGTDIPELWADCM